jgi:uncharacterized coiled-coil protein SlyX
MTKPELETLVGEQAKRIDELESMLEQQIVTSVSPVPDKFKELIQQLEDERKIFVSERKPVRRHTMAIKMLGKQMANLAPMYK